MGLHNHKPCWSDVRVGSLSWAPALLPRGAQQHASRLLDRRSVSPVLLRGKCRRRTTPARCLSSLRLCACECRYSTEAARPLPLRASLGATPIVGVCESAVFRNERSSHTRQLRQRTRRPPRNLPRDHTHTDIPTHGYSCGSAWLRELRRVNRVHSTIHFQPSISFSSTGERSSRS